MWTFFLQAVYEECYLSFSHHDRGKYVDGLMEVSEYILDSSLQNCWESHWYKTKNSSLEK